MTSEDKVKEVYPDAYAAYNSFMREYTIYTSFGKGWKISSRESIYSAAWDDAWRNIQEARSKETQR